MKKMFQISLMVFIFLFAASCGKSEKTQRAVVKKTTVTYCHTELIPVPLETSVVAGTKIVRTGQSIWGIVKDHQEKFSGYSREMFLADNPAIACRTPFTKLDPCDSSKVKYTSIPVYAGDIVYLRHPYRIDTIPGEGANIVWESGRGRLRHIIDIDDAGRYIVHENPFVCNNRVIVPPTDKMEVLIPPTNNDGLESTSSFTNWYPWLILLIVMLTGFIMLYRHIGNQHNQTRNHVREDGDETRRTIDKQAENLRTRVSELHKETSQGFITIASSIKEEGRLDREMLERQLDAERNSQKATLAAFMKSIRENGGLSGKKKEE